MGLSVFNQVDTTKYFSLSTINEERMKEYGLQMTVTELKQLAKQRVPAVEILTGDSLISSHQRITKCWRYEDFKSGGDK